MVLIPPPSFTPTMVWTPQRSVEKCNEIITAPGALHELETAVFWLEHSELHYDKQYIVYENERFTFGQMREKTLRAAAMLRESYNIGKGDKVGLCSRNYIEYLVAFWACHILGGVSVMLNAWLPQESLEFCITHTDCKILILDPERADVLENSIPQLVQANSMTGVLVFRPQEGKGFWKGILSWDQATAEYHNTDLSEFVQEELGIVPEDNATVYFTSGTTGRPKGVLSTQRQYLTNAFNVLIGTMRNILRKGESLDQPIPDEPQKGFLISVPFFHVTGTTSQGLLATMKGIKIVLIRKWSVHEAVRLIKAENIAIAGGVPSMVNELVDMGGLNLDSLNFGGAPSSILLVQNVKSSLPNTILSQGYGMTETNSVAVSITGADCELRPGSTGLPTPVNDLLIMDPHTLKEVPRGSVGEVWIRGINVMEGYWKDSEATERVMTSDKWLRSGDLGYIDKEGFLFIKDRLKDIIIRGGENIDSVSVENAVYAHPNVLEAAAIGVPDKKLGELVAVVVSLKPNCGKVTEEEVIAVARKTLPRFAVPVMVILQKEPLGEYFADVAVYIINRPAELTPSGKIIKTKLRVQARDQWLKRGGENVKKARL
ncbi:hypothetical protein D9757_000035 [Collybiopsis confluens]|uniref:Uncharacterized protein n=1 Tax=Collybiopsis confluens TaxID=2823264 RepID=A0A8H5MGR1_9AGAR|nr:hypothetical protein D9757_000035 [Collybiopsis confluens]